jgi:hypothetical protein
MSFECLECGESFSSERSLHAHFKAHKISVPEYYCKHFPRRDLFTGVQIGFKDKEEYFSTYFTKRQNLLLWLETTPTDRKAPIILDMLEKRINTKSLTAAPSEVELYFARLPPISEYKKCFGSYSAATKSCGVDPAFTGKLPDEWKNDFSRKKIFIDSREQNPLQFKNSECLKLDTGDYSVSGEDFCNTFVDRKSLDDWASTLTGDNYERFCREIQRCKKQDCFLWVVVEAPLEGVEEVDSYHKHKFSYISHQMRKIQADFRGSVQFVFSGGREQSQIIIPKLLCLGKKCWNVDINYWLKQLTNTDF